MTTVVYGKKIGMGEAYLGDVRRGVTKIALSPMTISQIKTVDKDGYSAAQVGFRSPKKHTVAKSRKPRNRVRRRHGSWLSHYPKMSSASVLCNIQVLKGKGFAGVVKRWNFAGGPRTHGQSDRLRAPGSIGQGTTPGRVHKGKKMPGRMGSDTVTMKNALVVAVGEDNTIWVTGPVPGARHSLVKLTIIGNKDDVTLSYLSGGLPVKIVESVVEVASEEVASDVAQIDPEPAEGVKE